MKTIQLLVFDFDGTLVDTRLDIADSVNRVLKDLGLRTLAHEKISTFIGRGAKHLIACALEGSGCDDRRLALQKFMKDYELHLMDRTKLYPHCRETLDFFSDKKMAILSNKPTRFIKDILDRLNCAEPFTTIIGGDTLGVQKPDPAGLLQMMNDCGLSGTDVLMVGDSVVDIETGRRAGVATCGITHGHASRDALEEAQADWVIDDLAELRRHFS